MVISSVLSNEWKRQRFCLVFTQYIKKNAYFPDENVQVFTYILEECNECSKELFKAILKFCTANQLFKQKNSKITYKVYQFTQCSNIEMR